MPAKGQEPYPQPTLDPHPEEPAEALAKAGVSKDDRWSHASRRVAYATLLSMRRKKKQERPP
jgi:hypothetical protein